MNIIRMGVNIISMGMSVSIRLDIGMFLGIMVLISRRWCIARRTITITTFLWTTGIKRRHHTSIGLVSLFLHHFTPSELVGFMLIGHHSSSSVLIPSSLLQHGQSILLGELRKHLTQLIHTRLLCVTHLWLMLLRGAGTQHLVDSHAFLYACVYWWLVEVRRGRGRRGRRKGGLVIGRGRGRNCSTVVIAVVSSIVTPLSSLSSVSISIPVLSIISCSLPLDSHLLIISIGTIGSLLQISLLVCRIPISSIHFPSSSTPIVNSTTTLPCPLVLGPSWWDILRPARVSRGIGGY